MKEIKLIGLLSFIVFFIACRKDGQEPVGPFKDILPITFNYDTITNLSPTYSYTNGVTTEFTVSNRERVLYENINKGARQVEFIKIITADKAQVYGAVRDGTPFTLDMKYSQSGKNYSFSGNYLIGDVEYTTSRSNDTMIVHKGISVAGYNTTEKVFPAAHVQIKGFTLNDYIALLGSGDTLYYKLFDILLIKKK